MRLSRTDRIVLGAGALVVLMLGAFAALLIVTHKQSVKDTQDRFRLRASTVASLTVTLFGTSQTSVQEQANDKLGGRRVNAADLEQVRLRNGWFYVEVLDDSGTLLAATPGAPTGRVRSRPAYVMTAAQSGNPTWSNAYGPGDSNDQALEWAVPYSVTRGRRVMIVGVRSSQVSDVVASIMSKFTKLADGQAAVLDGNGVVLASPTQGVRTGDRYPDAKVLSAMARTPDGDYGDDRRYASAALAGTPWRVLVTEGKGKLYEEINGARQTVPWIILVALAVMAAVGMYLMRRANLATAEVARREANRRYALEINDNVIQRLTVAKLAMETGQSEVTHEKLTDTLREAQALVTQLLGDKEVESGDLRRREHAPTA